MRMPHLQIAAVDSEMRAAVDGPEAAKNERGGMENLVGRGVFRVQHLLNRESTSISPPARRHEACPSSPRSNQ
jgi:hypothetical protein